eukprot:6466759-Amphidinium_carterae.1
MLRSIRKSNATPPFHPTRKTIRKIWTLTFWKRNNSQNQRELVKRIKEKASLDVPFPHVPSFFLNPQDLQVSCCHWYGIVLRSSIEAQGSRAAQVAQMSHAHNEDRLAYAHAHK